MADSRAEEALKRADSAFEAIAPYHAFCDDLAEIFYPERAFFTCEEAVGDEKYRHLYDGHPILMRWRLGNAIGSMSRGKGREWFRSKAFPYHLNKRQAVQAWCDDATETQRAIIYDPRAQFAAQMGLGDQDYVTFGSALHKITENRDHTGVLFRTPHLKSAAPEENSEGEIDVTHERPRLTGRTVGQLFAAPAARRAMSRALKEAIENDPNTKLDCIAQCVMPLDEYETSRGRRAPRGAQFVSLYMDRDEQTVLAEEFFWSFPYVWRRWMRSAGHIMGLSPCALVGLADGRMSQDIARTLGEAMEYGADPAKMISAGAIEGNTDLAPSGVNFVDRNYDFKTGKPIQPIDNGAMPNYAFDYHKHKQQFIAQAMLNNILTLPQERDLTAYEASRLLDEDAREAAPIFEPMEADNAAVMKRVRSIAARWGAFLPRPQELRGAEVRDEFETPVTIALDKLRAEQGMQAIAATKSLAELEVSFKQTGAFRRLDMAELQRDIFKGIGPASWLRDEAEAAIDIADDQHQEDMGKVLSAVSDTGLLKAAMAGGEGGAAQLPGPQAVPQLPAPAGALNGA